jgi:4a-hydroxytetrahydrobiopterin dehydratase
MPLKSATSDQDRYNLPQPLLSRKREKMRKLLSQQEIQTRMAKLGTVTGQAWELKDGKLHISLKFADFVTAFAFMTAAAIHAEKLNHHPEWSNVYNRVEIDLTTHDAGGITELDFKLAELMTASAR